MNSQPHLKNIETISPYVLLPGDPARVDRIGVSLDGFKIVGQNREFRIGSGTYRGIPITVCSTGIGCPSTAIAVEELINLGAKVLIRVGTCGGAWRKDIPLGSLVIPTACIRDEGTTREYIAPEFPAVADCSVVRALTESAKRAQARCFSGINRTHDAFYGAQRSITKWGSYLADERWAGVTTPILSSEMECAALYVIASLCRVQAGAVLAVNADPEPLEERIRGATQAVRSENSEEVTEVTVAQMITVALEAIVVLAAQTK